jgi:hypothetical protein
MDATGPLLQAHQLTFTEESARAEGAPANDAQAAWHTKAHSWDQLSEPYPLACGSIALCAHRLHA